MGTSVTVMAMSLAAQILLGFLLTKADFGVYAIAMAFYDFLRAVNDGGVGIWLLRATPDEFRKRASDAFWLTLLCSTATATLLAALAYPLGRVYGNLQVTLVILILALSLPLGTYRSVGLPGLHVQFQFRALSAIRVISAAVRYGLLVLLAYAGFGPLSFALPVLVVVVVESGLCLAIGGGRFWQTKPDRHQIGALFQSSRWSLLGSFAESIMRQSDYAILGLVVPTGIVGLYFFGYQLTTQLVLVFSESLRRVVLPVFGQLDRDSGRPEQGLVMCGTFLGLCATPCIYLIGVVARPLEMLLWHGRWSAAVPCIQLLALAMPFQLLSLFVEMLVQSRSRFGSWTTALFVRGSGYALAALVAGLCAQSDRVDIIAAIIAMYLVASAVVEAILLLAHLRLNAARLFGAFLPPVLCSLAVALLVQSAFDGSPPERPLVEALIRGAVFLVSVIVCFGILLPKLLAKSLRMIRRMVEG
jgi:O-antigen/teichoic acid export membrane protein